jgi:hypothetical protein
MTRDAEWPVIEALIAEQKYQAAADALAGLRGRAREAGARTDWTRALVQEVQLRAALGGVETAIRLLRDAERPDGPLEQTILRLLHAHSLARYLDVYGWEIGQRERVADASQVDLDRLTRAQIVAAIDREYAALWESRESWGAAPIGDLAEYLEQNDYPARIRGTLRDVVSYLWVEALANSAYWGPRESHSVYRLDLEALAGDAPAALEDAAHPLERLVGVLADLEGWHRGAERVEAAFEARRQRLEHLESHFTGAGDRKLLRDRLEADLARLGKRFEWWSVGQAQLARSVAADGEPNSLAAARDLAIAGRDAHPRSVGGRRCASLVEGFEAPEVTLESMRSDGAGRRSILIRHKNLDAVFLRAYRLDLSVSLTSGRDYSLLPGNRQVVELLASSEPDHEWRVELPPTPDLAPHRTYVTPPFREHGLYVVVASARDDFKEARNRIQAVHLVLSDLVVLARVENGRVDVDVRSGAEGAGLEGVEVELWRLDYRTGHRRVASARSSREGRASLKAEPGRRTDSMILVRRGSDSNFERVWLGRSQRRQPPDSTRSLIFTDRTVYRPLQKILWKVVTYDRVESEGRLVAAPHRTLTVDLVDANYDQVASVEVESNGFGSASGSFEIPAGRLLGSWQLRTSAGGQAQVQVEEYKRPTFEVTLAEPAEALRLNRPASLSGDARYYFGLPVVEGDVTWRVVRRPRYPDWWGWFRPGPTRGEELIAGGEARLDAEGRFALEFTPEADEREAASGVTYNYVVSVDVTDAGGETRSAERGYRLGYVAVEAAIATDAGFFQAGGAGSFAVRRTDLDGVGRPGEGSWRLVALEAPSEVVLPADEPARSGEGGYRTPGDLLRPRWSTGYHMEGRLRAWPDGETLAEGELRHDEDGEASIEIEALPPGALRLYYETHDAFGAKFETRHELIVAGGGGLPLPAALAVERATVQAGGSALVLVHSGLPGQELLLEIARPGRPAEERRLTSGEAPQTIDLPVSETDVGGVRLRLTALRDHQLLSLEGRIHVPPEDPDLQLQFATFRDRLRPGTRERWRVVVAAGDEALAEGAAEVLGYMYDRSLDLFAPHRPPRPGGFERPAAILANWLSSLGQSSPVLQKEKDWRRISQYPHLRADRLRFFDAYGIGGPGRRTAMWMGGPQTATMAMEDSAPEVAEVVAAKSSPAPPYSDPEPDAAGGQARNGEPPAPPAGELRTDFSETAFWEPHLVTDREGAVAFEFTVPDSLTEWNVWVHALTRELRYGSLQETATTAKELLVRPYLPRFLREGDEARFEVVVQNAGEEPLAGELELDLLDPATEASLAEDFGLTDELRRGLAFEVEPGGSTTLSFSVVAPGRVGLVAVRVTAEAGEFSDGELRPLPLLPGRFHLRQSRFAALQDSARRELVFADLAADDDPSRIDEQLVVTLDAQLFYSVLNALPYLVDYPYECTEQTLNRFLSTGIVGSVFDEYPAVARMAAELAERETPLEPWVTGDPNRRMALEETPWLRAAAGGEAPESGLIRVLDPRIAAAQRDAALAKLANSQTSLGAFPWWPGGPPSPYMTLYIVSGLSRALEFGLDVPEEMVVRAWQYLHRHYVDEIVQNLGKESGRHETITFLNHVLSSYPDESWTGGVFSADDRRRMLDHSFAHWKKHSPLLKSYLALTLLRAGRSGDARLVFDSVMDSARTTEDEGTFWAPEDRAWLWYNDTIESHAFALRALTELSPSDARRQGLVHWLMLNKKLNHWKSTRATAEVIYSLVHYLAAEGQLGAREAATVRIGDDATSFVFEPEEFTGRNVQVVVEGSDIDPVSDSTIVVEKDTPGLLFASATWHFSTEKPPERSSGDFFAVERAYFRRLRRGDEWVLEPLAEGYDLAPGDQVEVRLTLRARHAAEYVHLRDPRAAGFEPETLTSSYRWDLGIGWYEQVRDSGTDFFFEWLPAGEYAFRYRLRASLGGKFKAAPATVQSMYAPEFNAYSAGATLSIDSE